jgi:ribonucleoside-diphosphate reductase alpha chain
MSSMLLMAWQTGCKGFTVYREGSRRDVVLEKISTEKPLNPVSAKLASPDPDTGRFLPKTPRLMPAAPLHVARSGCSKLMMCMGEAFGSPHTIICTNEGGCTAMTHALVKMIALSMRWGIPTWDISKTLMSVSCDKAKHSPRSDGISCAAIIGKYIRDNTADYDVPVKKSSVVTPAKETTSAHCPECGEEIAFLEGCPRCIACGWSHCNG